MNNLKNDSEMYISEKKYLNLFKQYKTLRDFVYYLTTKYDLNDTDFRNIDFNDIDFENENVTKCEKI